MQKQKGITLIALIITVILLLILLGTSLGIVLRGDFFGKARKTAKMTDEKISSEGNTIEKGQNDWEQMEVDICSHIWGKEQITLAPTCTTPGKKSKKCENCGKTIEIETPALGHNYENRVCTRCGENEPGCTTHTYGSWVVTKEATCIAEGSRKRSCTVCGVEQVEIIEATGLHNFVNGKCSNCGLVLAIGANINYHEYLGENGNTITLSYISAKSTRCSTQSNSDSDATFKIVNNSYIQWIVLGEENGQIKITVKNVIQPITGGYTSGGYKKLVFQGKNGYTNFVDELDNIGAIYGKGKGADTTKFNGSGGRSFKKEDLGYSALTRTVCNTYQYNGINFEYMELDASTSTSEGLHTWKNLSSTNSNVTLYNYTYNGTSTLSTDVSKRDTYYWLASRCISAGDTVQYGASYLDDSGNDSAVALYKVDTSGIATHNFANNNISTYSMNTATLPSHFQIDSETNLYAAAFRPVVYLNPNIKLTYDTTNGYTIDS